MAKSEPENRADLYRMLETSDGWFDGTRQKKWTCTRFGCFHHMVKPDGFCSWGVRREP